MSGRERLLMVSGLVDLVKPVDQEVVMVGRERNVQGRTDHEQVIHFSHSARTAFPSLNVVVRVASRRDKDTGHGKGLREWRVGDSANSTACR